MNQSIVPPVESSSPHEANDVAARIARQSLAGRGAAYANEVRRLLEAGREVMRRCGTTSRPRVADIVAAAGLSNDAFYRHFPSKDALVAALLEDGTEQLAGYLRHQMAKESTPERKVRRWVEGVFSQADEEIAATTLAVLWNAGSLDSRFVDGPTLASRTLSALLREPFAALGSSDPEFDAALAGHGVVGSLAECLWQRRRPTAAELDRLTAYCLRTAASAPTAP